MATRAAKAILRCVFVGRMSMYDLEIDRRPYHRNCSCALHKLKGACSDACSQQKNNSFRKKELWNDCCLSITASNYSSQSSFLGNSSIRNVEDANGTS